MEPMRKRRVRRREKLRLKGKGGFRTHKRLGGRTGSINRSQKVPQPPDWHSF